MNNTTACSKSWTDVNIDFKSGTLGHCCKSVYYDIPTKLTSDFFSNSELIQKRRQDTLDGKQHQDCKECWNEVNQGRKSYINYWNKWENFDNVKADVPQIENIEIELDNTCDLSCLYCAAEQSSSIAKEEGIKIVDRTSKEQIEAFKHWLKSTIEASEEILQLTFSGGEPTASKLFYELIEYIGTLDTSKVKIDVITNGNSKPYLLKKLINAIENSTARWSITISNESYKEDSQLIRYGLDWNRFEENVKTYASTENIEHIHFGTTLSNVAVPTFPLYVKWIYETMKPYTVEFSITGGIIMQPKEMDIAILPKHYKLYIEQALDIVNSYPESNCIRERSFFDYLDVVYERIGSNRKQDYKEIIEVFLEKKQNVKKTDTLMRLKNV